MPDVQHHHWASAAKNGPLRRSMTSRPSATRTIRSRSSDPGSADSDSGFRHLPARVEARRCAGGCHWRMTGCWHDRTPETPRSRFICDVVRRHRSAAICLLDSAASWILWSGVGAMQSWWSVSRWPLVARGAMTTSLATYASPVSRRQREGSVRAPAESAPLSAASASSIRDRSGSRCSGTLLDADPAAPHLRDRAVAHGVTWTRPSSHGLERGQRGQRLGHCTRQKRPFGGLQRALRER